MAASNPVTSTGLFARLACDTAASDGTSLETAATAEAARPMRCVATRPAQGARVEGDELLADHQSDVSWQTGGVLACQDVSLGIGTLFLCRPDRFPHGT